MVTMSADKMVIFLPMNFHNPLIYINLFVKLVEKMHCLLTVKSTTKTVQDNFGVSTDGSWCIFSELEI